MERPFSRPALLLAISAFAMGSVAGPSLGQTRSEQPGRVGQGGVRAGAPSPTPGLGGVRSEAPFVRPLGSSPTNSGVNLPPPGKVVPLPTGGSLVPVSVGTTPRRIIGQSGFGGGRGFVTTEGSGFSASGGFSDSGSRFRFHIGSGFEGVGRFRGFGGSGHSHRRHGSGFVTYPFFSNNPWWYDTGNRYSTIYGVYSPLDPSMVAGYVPAAPTMPAPVTQQVRPSNDKELGTAYLSAGAAPEAVTALRTWLRDNPADAEGLRLLAVALVESGELSDAAATMALAYHTDPGLAGRPVAPEVFGAAARVREDVRRASVYANRVKSGSTWLVVAVLMQAEGRERVARTIVERAKAAGLEAAVADRFLATLR